MYFQQATGTYTPIKSVKLDGKPGFFYEVTEAVEDSTLRAFRQLGNSWDSSVYGSVSDAYGNLLKSDWLGVLFKDLKIPKQWVQDGVESPSAAAIEISKRVARSLWTQFELRPYAVEPSIEGGVMLNYKKGEKYIAIEIDNDKDVNCVGSIGKKISFSNSLNESEMDVVGAFFKE